MSNCLCRCLRIWMSYGHQRKSAGRSESEPISSAVRRDSNPGWSVESVEPLIYWRRLERLTAGQENRLPDRGTRDQERPKYPKGNDNGVSRLSGVAGMACAESFRVKRGRSNRGIQRYDCPTGAIIPDWKSEGSVVVMTTGTAKPHTSEGTLLLQRLDERRWPGKSSLEVEHARR